MSQLSLFRPERPEPPRRPPDLPYIRKSLHSRLRTVRAAEIMPGAKARWRSGEKLFPELAAYLPADEAELLDGGVRRSACTAAGSRVQQP